MTPTTWDRGGEPLSDQVKRINGKNAQTCMYVLFSLEETRRPKERII